MRSVTDLYSINYNLAMCEVWLASCFILVALGFTEILMAMIFLSASELIVGTLVALFGLINFVEKDTKRYYWLAAKDRII
jgi:hypothetical protein